MSDSPQKTVVSVESVCDAPSDGHTIDLRCCSPPMAWPWPEEQTHSLAQKARLRPLTSSLLGNVIVPPQASPWQTLHCFYSGVLGTWTGPRSLCIHSVTGPSPAVTRELVIRIFKLKPLCMLSRRLFVTLFNISEVRSQREQFINLLLRSCNLCSLFSLSVCLSITLLVLFSPHFLTFLPFFIVWGFEGQH